MTLVRGQVHLVATPLMHQTPFGTQCSPSWFQYYYVIIIIISSSELLSLSELLSCLSDTDCTTLYISGQ